ncbi:MAG TPA: PstS family phosphate ABC transporter substrate-binding protein [Spirochaetota bacterium]|nr:PstS family phosphate ABC transporter substrate-binding protein [Spirochaetota bacterium]
MNITIKKIFSVLAVIAVSVAVFSSCSKGSGEKIVVKGSTTVLPITQKAAEAYRKINRIPITIEGSGSGNGIKALIDGTCSIANSSREMKDKERKSAEEKGITVKEITVAIDMIVPVVHPENPVKNLSMDQLKGIYDGSISNWKQLGGKNEKIVVISRDTSSGTYEVWHEKIMKKTDVSKEALLQASNGAVVSAVAGNPKAIGYIGFGYLDSSVKGLSVKKIQPTLDNGKSGKFPVSRKLYMYIDEKKISGEAQKFIDFMLSDEGQKLVSDAGFISK